MVDGQNILAEIQLVCHLIRNNEMITSDHLDFNAILQRKLDGALGVGAGRVQKCQKTSQLPVNIFTLRERREG